MIHETKFHTKLKKIVFIGQKYARIRNKSISCLVGRVSPDFRLDKVLDVWKDAKHLKEQVGRGDGGHRSRVVDGSNLDEVAADQVESSAASDDLEGLDGREAANLRGAGSGASRGVDGVDVEREVDRGLGVGKLAPDASHQGCQRLMPELLNL